MRTLRRRMMIGKYERIKYLKFQKENYIDTLYVPNEKTQIFINFNLDTIGNNEQFVFGGGERIFEVFTWGRFSKGNYMGQDPSFDGYEANSGVDISLFANKARWTYNVDGNVLKDFLFSSIPKTTSLTIMLNRLNRNGGVWVPDVGKYKLYEFRIYESSTDDKGCLIHDFIPVRRRSDGKIGLLDNVEGKFYTSPNGIDFTGG